MGFLSKIFKPKPGGTLIGNLIRGTASKFTGGLLGGGSMLRAQETANGWRDANGNLTPAGYQALNEGKMDPEVSGAIAQGVINGAVATPSVQEGAQNAFFMKLKEFWYWILLVILAIIGTIFLFRRKNNQGVSVQTNSFGAQPAQRSNSNNRRTQRR